MTMVRSDGNGGYIIKKVVAHVIGYSATLLISGLIWYIALDRSKAIADIEDLQERTQALEVVVPQIGNDVETILTNQKRAAERAGIEFIEPQRQSTRYNLKREGKE